MSSVACIPRYNIFHRSGVKMLIWKMRKKKGIDKLITIDNTWYKRRMKKKKKQLI